jgi:Holliday junction resolvase RusA-like endonuclease
MVSVSFTVHGVPAPQGSKTSWGAEANPRTRPWRAAVTAEGALAMKEAEPIIGPVHIVAEFVFPRPKSHFRTGRNEHLLRERAPTHHSSKPDLDKLLRAIGDALTGVVIRDDSQIVSWDTFKRYGVGARVILTVSALPDRTRPVSTPCYDVHTIVTRGLG